MGYPTKKTQYKTSWLQKNLPYELIAEVTQSELWNTPNRKRTYTERFTVEERDNLRRITKTAIRWTEMGVPAVYLLSDEGFRLWQRFGVFCKELKHPGAGSAVMKEAPVRLQYRFGKTKR